MSLPASRAFFEASISDNISTDKALSYEVAMELYLFFKNCPVFKWGNASNDCEDRANAMCILLDEWKVPNYKGWVFGGGYLKKGEGQLINYWNYHVATILPVKKNNEIVCYVVDPATNNSLVPIDDWAAQVTHMPASYYVIKEGVQYIFSSGVIKKDNWHKRDRRNYKWTIQGLAGINGVSRTGKAQVCFKKKCIKRTDEHFKKLKRNKPAFI